jgi:non-specific serine/threonine protein kinase
VLVTSRAVLRLSGEHEYPVLPLATPVTGRPVPLHALAANDAVTVFVQRARAVRPDFALDASNAVAVAEICARLDGLPLAIELAAARVKVLPPEALLTRLGSGLDLLAGGPRDQAARLRSMRAAIAWSYDLLDPGERALFRRLSVFSGGFTLAAAEAVATTAIGVGRRTPESALSVLDGIMSLVDKSLLRRLDAAGDEPRFGMLSTIQEYGLEQLTATGEEAVARRSHADHVLELAERAALAFRRRADQEPWLDVLEADRGNIRVALTWLHEVGDAATCLLLAGALSWFWYIRGPLGEGRSWLERALADTTTDAPDWFRVRAMVGAGLLAHFQGDDDQARAWLEASLARSPEIGDTWLRAFALLMLGLVAEDHGDYSLAEVRFLDALSLFRAADDRSNAALALTHLAVAAWGLGDAARAAELCEEAVAMQRASGDDWGIAVSLGYLGLIAGERGDVERAAAVHRESLGIRWRARAWEDVAGSLADLAVLAAMVDRSELVRPAVRGRGGVA